MIETVREMAHNRDGRALSDLWELLGGTGSRFLPPKASVRQFESAGDQIVLLLRALFPGRHSDVYAGERAALAEVGSAFEVDSSRFAQTSELEDAIYAAIGQRLEERLSGMSDAKRAQFVEQALKRWTEEDRVRLIEGVAAGYERMDDAAKQALVTELSADLGASVTEAEVEEALRGGAAALVPLLLARQQGFALYIGSTRLMYSVLTSGLGLKTPFAAYMLKNQALGWLLGPVGMLVTTGATAGWWAYKARRETQRMRKLIQVIAYTAAWRDPA